MTAERRVLQLMWLQLTTVEWLMTAERRVVRLMTVVDDCGEKTVVVDDCSWWLRRKDCYGWWLHYWWLWSCERLKSVIDDVVATVTMAVTNDTVNEDGSDRWHCADIDDDWWDDNDRLRGLETSSVHCEIRWCEKLTSVSWTMSANLPATWSQTVYLCLNRPTLDSACQREATTTHYTKYTQPPHEKHTAVLNSGQWGNCRSSICGWDANASRICEAISGCARQMELS